MRAAEAIEVQAFCLATIHEAFGYEYRPDWHGDIDQLTEPVHCYHPARGGAFVVARVGPSIAGCGGLRPLATHDRLAGRFAGRYGAGREVGSIWRVYVSAPLRSRGLGHRIAAELEREASRLGYRRLYLHTSARTPRSVEFWQRQGFEPFSHDPRTIDSTVHMDKVIPVAQPAPSALRAPLGLAR
jgi:GNAT superfamily N-acetyltransferase